MAENNCCNPSYATTRRLTELGPDGASTLPANPGRQGEGGLRTRGCGKKALPGLPLVTIVTPVFNGERYLAQTIESVLGQEYDNLEYIIIDGGSTDGTLEIIRRYEHAVDYWVSEADRGQTEAINKGFAIAGGDLLVWLNYDDLYFPETVGTVVERMTRAGASFSYGHAELIDAAGARIKDHVTCRQTLRSYQADAGGNVFQGTVFFSRELWDRFGPLDTGLKCAFEYRLFDRFFGAEKGVYINEVLARYRLHSDAISTVHADRFAGEFRSFRPEAGSHRAFYRIRRNILNLLDGHLARKISDALHHLRNR